MSNTANILKILLWLIALHSFIVGLILISTGNAGMQYFGFKEGNEFFQVQGGVFHLVMCTAYIIASLNLEKSKGLIIFIILAKTIATLYLLIFYFLIDDVITILLAGIGDGLMGLLVYILYFKMLTKKSMEDFNA
jgi:hypothetical protein